MVIVEVITALVGYVRDYTQRVYTILVDVLTQLWRIVSFFFNVFPYDQPRKTLLLGIFWLLFTGGLLIAFSGDVWYEDGVSGFEEEMVLYSVSPILLGDETLDTGEGAVGEPGVSPGEEEEPQTPPEGLPGYGEGIDCMIDEDCKYFQGEYMGDRLCCFPDMYADYSCAGKCLYDVYTDRDACKHPNACLYYGESWEEHSNLDDPNRCDVQQTPDKWCQNRVSVEVNDLSYCCERGFEFSPCYGYCLKDVPGADCWDLNSCFEESYAYVVALEPGEIYG